MNNYTLNTADRLTHLKIVAVSLVAGIVVVGVGIAARPELPDMSTRLESRAPVLVTSPQIRPFVRGIVERFRAQTSVLSQSEIHPRVRLKTVGSI